MNQVLVQPHYWQKIKINIINIVIFIGLLRLTNFNYFLSQILGFETTVNATGGNAFNFTNYFAGVILVLFLVTKANTISWHKNGTSQFIILAVIYILNFFLAPYANPLWVLYQLIFLTVAFVLYIYAQKYSYEYGSWRDSSIGIFFWFCIGFVIFAIVTILGQVSLSYYFSEFNDAFVQSLDEYGIMKQRYGYLLGFLSAYTLYIIRGRGKKIMLISLLLFAGFGIRSFVLGLLGATILFSLRKPAKLGVIALGFLIVLQFIPTDYFEGLIYDTRFYSFLNAYDIVQKFPFGVGLGGYPVYTDIFSRSLLADFYNWNAVLDYIPVAPESDLVHLFGSLGFVFGSIHLGVQMILIWYTYKLNRWFSPFQKCMLFYFCFMTFFGISEDSIFSINYWIFFGLAAGCISNVLIRNRQM